MERGIYFLFCVPGVSPVCPRTTAGKKEATTKSRKSLSLFILIGGAKEDRTPDLMTASHALSQLSYGPTQILEGQI